MPRPATRNSWVDGRGFEVFKVLERRGMARTPKVDHFWSTQVRFHPKGSWRAHVKPMLRRIVLGLAVVVGSTSAFSSPHISALSHSVGQSSAKLISHVGALTARSGLKRPILAMGLVGMGKTEKGASPRPRGS